MTMAAAHDGGGDRDFGASWLQVGAAPARINQDPGDAQGNGLVADGQLSASQNEAVRAVHDAVVGHGASFSGPYGAKQLLYADWAASGRALSSLERYIADQVLPMYANTHTTTSVSGLQSTCFRMEARQIVAQAVNARVHYQDKHADVVVFTGAGSTAAVRHLVHVLGLHLPLAPDAPEAARPVVFVGPYEHHSNLLPWRESCALVEAIPEDADGRIDLAALERALQRHAHRHLRLGSFSAASNVTGVVSDIDRVTELLHRHGALAFWDYAAGAPYLPIDMNPVVTMADGRPNPYVYKDAVFVSMHKFPGGPGTPGLLVAKRALFQNAVPSAPGGGTVFYVTASDHRYLSNREEREEGGTQDIVASVRAGLVWQVREAVGQSTICHAEGKLTQRFHQLLSSNSKITILGPPVQGPTVQGRFPTRLPLVSMMVRAPQYGGQTRFLHYSFVCALLNDVFGVQARGGCACAGPYGISLLGISPQDSAAIEAHLLDKMEVLRPGFVRISLPYFAEDAEIELVVGALHAIAENGWRVLPDYSFNYKTGEWRHSSRLRSFPERRWLADFKFPGLSISKNAKTDGSGSAEVLPSASDWKAQLEAGEAILRAGSSLTRGGRARTLANQSVGLEQHSDGGSGDTDSTEAEALRWFMLPAEAAGLLLANSRSNADLVDDSNGAELAGAMHPKEYGVCKAPSEQVASAAEIALQGATGKAKPLEGESSMPRSASFVSQREGGADLGSSAAAPATGTEAGPEILTPIEQTGTTVDADPVGRKESRKHPLRGGALGTPSTGPGLNSQQLVRMQATDASMLADAADRGAANIAAGGAVTSAAPTHDAPQATKGKGPMKKQKRAKPGQPLFVQPPAKLMSAVSKALKEWEMIRGGDRLLLGLSGGKDSLALLHCLLAYQRRAPPASRFEIAAATVDPMTSAFIPRPLIEYMQGLGVTYHYLEQPIFDAASSGILLGDSICSFCARMKRGVLYKCCQDNNYNVLVLAQHLDDLAESFMMFAMFNGVLRTMKANYTTDDGALRVIRPLIYARERLTRDFAYAASLPVITENCPACFEAPKERQHIKKMLAREESLNPILYASLRSAMSPLMDITLSRMVQAHSRVWCKSHPDHVKEKAPLGQRSHQPLIQSSSDDAGAQPPVLLTEASQDALMAELALRTGARRKESWLASNTGEGSLDSGHVTQKRGGSKAGADNLHRPMDSTLDGELEEKLLFCTAEGCTRPPPNRFSTT